MKLKELLTAYEDVYCHVVTPTNIHYIKCDDDKRLILMMYGDWIVDSFRAYAYGDWIVDSFCTYAYDDFNGFIRIKINEPNTNNCKT